MAHVRIYSIGLVAVFTGAIAVSAATSQTTPSRKNTTRPGTLAGPPPATVPPEIKARLRGCSKPSHRTLGQVLAQLGVNLGDLTVGSAGSVYANMASALGTPSLDDNQQRERVGHTQHGAAALFDLMLAAAPEIEAGMPSAAVCEASGVGTQMFDPGTGACNENAVSCLLGFPATAAHVSQCTGIVNQATPGDTVDEANKRHLAIATVLASAYVCE